MKKSKQVRGPRRNVLVAGDKINQLRLERGWTQEDLADVSNVSLSTIKRSLRSVDAKISYQVATDLAAALEVRLSQIGFGVETAHVEAQHHARFARNGSTETVESRLTKDRFEQLYEVAVGFTQSYANEYGVQCEVSPSFLYQAAYKAYDQILASHQTSDAAYGVFRSNGYFRAAALSLNIARYRPIWVSGDVEAAEEQDFLDLALINEIFSVFVATFVISAETGEDVLLSDADHLDLVQYLHHGGDMSGLLLILKNVFSNYLR